MSSLYGSRPLVSMEQMANSDAVLESLIVEDVLRGTSDQIKEFCESAEAKVLQEKGVLKKPTMMRLSKQDDENRRIKLMAYKIARDANDVEWNKLVKYQALRKECIQKIMTKYGAKAKTMAKIAQKNYIKTAAKLPDKSSKEVK